MQKIMYLLGIHTLSFFHKLRHDLIRELVVGFCSLIILALFYYIFNDFLNMEVKTLSPTMRDRFAEVLAYLLVFASSLGAGRILRTFIYEERSLFQTSRMLGEAPSFRKSLFAFHTFLVLSFVYVPMWICVDCILVKWSALKIFLLTLTMLVLSLSQVLFKEKINTRSIKLKLSWSYSSDKAMLVLRLQSLFFRNRLTQFCFILFVVCAILNMYAAFVKVPFVASIALSFWGAFLAACALCFQAAEDLEASWLEKSSGVSHQTFMRMLFSLSFLVGILVGTVSALLFFLGAGISGEHSLESLHIFFISALPSWVVPNVLFQIEGRRPLLSILASFLIALFLCTAVYASWFALGLIGILCYYGWTSQEGRFYRA